MKLLIIYLACSVFLGLAYLVNRIAYKEKIKAWHILLHSVLWPFYGVYLAVNEFKRMEG